MLNQYMRKSSMIAIFVNIKMQKMYICRFILYQFMKMSSMVVINETNNLHGQLITCLQFQTVINAWGTLEKCYR